MTFNINLHSRIKNKKKRMNVVDDVMSAGPMLHFKAESVTQLSHCDQTKTLSVQS